VLDRLSDANAHKMHSNFLLDEPGEEEGMPIIERVMGVPSEQEVSAPGRGQTRQVIGGIL